MCTAGLAADLQSAGQQVQWGLTKGGPYPFTAGGYATAYIQVTRTPAFPSQIPGLKATRELQGIGPLWMDVQRCILRVNADAVLPALQTYLHDGPTFVSELLHNVHITGLPYGVPIYYR